jgi:hypothetical protein
VQIDPPPWLLGELDTTPKRQAAAPARAMMPQQLLEDADGAPR